MGLNFRLYRSGIHLVDILFDGESIIYREKDIYENRWSEPTNYNMDENVYKVRYDLDIQYITRILTLSGSGIFAGERFDFEDRIYEKYKTYAGKDGADSVIWAERKRKFPIDIITIGGVIAGFICTKREECLVLVREGYEEFTPQKLWERACVSKPEYGIKTLNTYMVSMRDGVKLATDVWVPYKDGFEGKFPVVFVRTPYGKSKSADQYLRFVQRGYALVIQDVRGREDSEGEFDTEANERLDGDDSLNWIHSQSWCDGNIGMIGASYLGYVQWAAASSGNPHLKAIVSIVTSGSPFIDFPRKGGAMASGILAWLFSLSEKKFRPEAMIRDDWDSIVNIRPIGDIPKKVLGRTIAMWNGYMEHSTYDEFWRKADWSAFGDKIDVPALMMSGWFDDNGQGTLEAWKMNKKHGRENIKLILGPWLHKANTVRDIGDISFGNNAIRYDLDLIFQMWFDRYLKGFDNGIDQKPKVEYYIQGSEKWSSSDTWTPKEAERRELLIWSTDKANGCGGGGKLGWVRGLGSEYDEYVYDPQNPVPHLIDISENELNVPANYREVEKRQDVLVYTSDVLEDDMTVAGEVYAEIYAESSARDTDWVVRLTDVDEAGNSRRLVDGIYRARYINDFKEEKLLENGEIRKYRINMFHTANTFKKGHRIRAEITSSAENLVFPNHNTGKDFARDTEYLKAVQKIYHSNKYPSHISLPIVVEPK